MGKERGTTGSLRYQTCVASLAGWRLLIDDERTDLAEIISPTGMSFTSMVYFEDDLIEQGYSGEYIDRYMEEVSTVNMIWDCINSRNIADE